MGNQCHLVMYALFTLMEASDRLSARIKTVQEDRDRSLSQSDTRNDEDSFLEEVASLWLQKVCVDDVFEKINLLEFLLSGIAFPYPEQRSQAQEGESEVTRSDSYG